MRSSVGQTGAQRMVGSRARPACRPDSALPAGRDSGGRQHRPGARPPPPTPRSLPRLASYSRGSWLPPVAVRPRSAAHPARFVARRPAPPPRPRLRVLSSSRSPYFPLADSMQWPTGETLRCKMFCFSLLGKHNVDCIVRVRATFSE